MAEGSGSPDITPQPERSSPTGASISFLDRMRHNAKVALLYAGSVTGNYAGGLPIALQALEADKAKLGQKNQRKNVAPPKEIVERQKQLEEEQNESVEKTPTEASNNFLNKWIDKIGKTYPIAPIIAATTIRELGGFNVISDITEGRWVQLAAKGIVAGVAASPIVREAVRLMRSNRES